MRLPLLGARAWDFSVEPLVREDAAALARLHAEDFARPWNEAEFAALLEQRTVFGYAARQTGRGGAEPAGFALARLAAGEGEILTLAVARAHRRRGLGWLLMDAVLRALHRERAEALFLEVDETNLPAVNLYKRLGFHQVGYRARYYENHGRPHTGALVMRRDLA